MRNNLEKHNFQHGENKIDWRHIVNFYDYFHKNESLVAEVFSHSVAAGIETLIILGKLPLIAKTTADFVDFMDSLFNSFISSS